MSLRHQSYLSPTPSLSASLNRRHPLLRHRAHSSSAASVTTRRPPSPTSARCSRRLGEVVGGTAAECAAICCCCPCGLVNLLVLTIYKLPAGICRAALRRKRRAKLIKRGLLPPRASRRCKCGCDDTEIHIHHARHGGYGFNNYDPFFAAKENNNNNNNLSLKVEEDREMVKLEKEMWETFYGTGFWRSPSQREQLPPPPPTAAAVGVRRSGGSSIPSSPTKGKLL